MESQASQPDIPKAPALKDQINDYISSLPAIYSATQQYQPQFQALDYQLQSQYAPQYKALEESLYPELSALRNQLTSQATTGSQAELPSYMRDQYLNQFRAEVGSQNGSGIGADYISRNMLNQVEQYRSHYQNMGMSLIGKQPLYQAADMQQAYNPSAGYNAGTALNYGASTYGNYVGAYSSMYGANANILNNNNNLMQKYAGAGLNIAGSMIPGAGSVKGAFG